MLIRMISLFLCAAMIVTMLPVQTIALETEKLTTQILETEPVEEKTEPVEDEVDPLGEVPTEDETEPVEEENESTEELEQIEQEPMLSDDSIIASGTCGDNLTWELDKGGKLTISGTGEMSYYTSTKQVPWYNYAYFISEISLPEGLGSIAGYSFANCHSVKSITIPESVYIIYGNAFLYTGITSLTIPKNVASIDIMCFQSCYDLKEITVDPENEYYCSVDGIMFSKDLSTLHYYPCGMSGETFTVPDNITTIGDFAFFSCTNLKNIELPDGLSEIGFAAFQGAGFKTITIPASIDYIDGYAFFSCDELTDVYFTGTEEQWNTLVENRLGPDNNSLLNATIHCSGDAAPTEPEETESTEPEDDTIRGTCGANLTWALKDGVLTISGTGDMSFDSAYEAPWQVYAGRITEIVLETGVTSVAEGAFAVCRMESITIPEGVLSIGDSAFDSCKNLTSIILPDSLTSIGFNAFSHTPLTGVTIPENVSNIGAGAFQYCTKLTSITVDEKNPNYYSVDGVLFENAWNRLHTYPSGKAGELYCVPEGIKRIGDSAFTGCSNLIHIEVPEGIEYMQWLIGVDNLAGIVLPSSLSYISFQMFEYCDALTDIYYTGTEEQWEKLLQNTNSTENPSLFDGSITVHCNWTGEPVENIIAEGICGPTATWTLTETGTLTISGSGMVTEAPWREGYLNQIIKLIIEDGITILRSEAFTNCTMLRRVLIPKTMTGIGGYAFANCTSLADVFIMSKKLTIDDYAFSGCNAVKKVFYGVSERNLGSIQNSGMNGNEILLDAESLFFDWDDPMETHVMIKRHGVWHDAVEEQLTLSIGSYEAIEISMIRGLDDRYNVAAFFCIDQNGRNLLRNYTGEFENVVLHESFIENGVVTAKISDSYGKILYEQILNLRIRDGYMVTYVFWDNKDEFENITSQNILSQTYASTYDIVPPEEPIRDGYYLAGWYASPDFTGAEFFSERNYYNRVLLEKDITLYAKWVKDDGRVLTRQDIWSFANNDDAFRAKIYEISTGDLFELIKDLDDTTRERIIEEKNAAWGGSCFGMSSTVVLGLSGDFDINLFDSSCNAIHDASLFYNLTSATVGAVESAINFYQLRQCIGKIDSKRIQGKGGDESQNLHRIVDKMQSTDKPVVLMLDGEGGSDFRHSVVAFGLEKTQTGYQFFVYDCSRPQQFYPVTIKDINGTLYASCYEWEQACGVDIFFRTCMTATELKAEKILVKPALTSKVRSMEVDTQTEEYLLETTYDSFTITSKTGAAVISGGKKVSGDLEILCYGNTREPGYSPKYQFYLPVLLGDDVYTITRTVYQKGKTILYYDHADDGFFIKEEFDQVGELRFSANASVSTKYPEETDHMLKVTINNTRTPWNSVEIHGVSTGFHLVPGIDSASVCSETDTTVTIKTNNAFNSTSLLGIPVGNNMVQVKEGENDICVVTQNNNTIASSDYGYSVLFNSNLGTNVESLQNVQSGSMIPEPTAPTRTGYLFEGWFKDTEYTEQWDFASDTVTEDIVLYAGWSVDPNYMKSVTFRVSGMDDQIVYMPVNSLIPVEYAPTASDGGAILWYTDRACTEPWNFETDTLTGSLILYGQVDTHVENRLTVDSAELDGLTSAWIDGREFTVKTMGDVAYVDLPNADAKTMVTYTYQNADDADVHTHIPTGMKVWTLSNTDGFYTATRVEELDDMLGYAGCSIRVKGNQGIRMITSIDEVNKDALTSEGLAGYTLKEYGTAIAWASQIGTTKPLTLGKSYVSSNYAYKKNVADPIFNSDGDVMQYTNVLVGFTLDQCSDDIAMRPYMILKDTEGNEITLYGGIVERSIGYIAQQNQDIYAEGTEEYAYIMNIINHVYGEDNPV